MAHFDDTIAQAQADDAALHKHPPTRPNPATNSSFFSSSFSGIVGGAGGIVRRFSNLATGTHDDDLTEPSASTASLDVYDRNNGIDGVYTPSIYRSASPMRPPVLEPLALRGFRFDTPPSARLLTTTIAEEIRILVPDRQRIEEQWNLVYSLDEDGVSLGTLYEKCAQFTGGVASFVLVVRDNEGAIFGAYLSEAPHPAAHYFGNGECFLWRASTVPSLPPPPSADTSHIARASTIAPVPNLLDDRLSPHQSPKTPGPVASPASGHSNSMPPHTPIMRFKAFPYSGENEFYMYCEPTWLSIGGGDGHYALWLDASLEKGVSSRCLTFGNEPLSDEGEKFGVLGVEVWMIGKGT